jgi:hypothetical protein
MSRPRLRSSQQSLPVQLLLGTYEFLASLRLAVTLISVLSLVLAYGTYVEKVAGSNAAKFLIYGSPWFLVLNLLLATNIFCAAAIRFPWKRYQTGFVITHIGLLVLLFGCWMSWRFAIDAQMPILERGSNSVAYDSAGNVLDVQVERLDKDAEPEERLTDVRLRLEAGPFNWQDYGNIFAGEFLGRFQKPEWFVSPDAGKLRDPSGKLQDLGVTVEVVDFYGNSKEIRVPQLTLEVSTPQLKEGVKPEGMFAQFAGEPVWNPTPLAVSESQRHPLGDGQRETMGGGSIGFWLLGDAEELALFLEKPDVIDLGYEERGQVIVRANGQTHRFLLDDLIDQILMPLGDSGLQVELVRHYPFAIVDPRIPDRVKLIEVSRDAQSSPAVELVVHDRKAVRSTPLTLIANRPEVRVPQGEWKVHGSYWVDQGAQSGQVALAGAGAQRLDIVQSHDKKLYYRRWDRRQVSEAGPFPTEPGKQLTGLEMAQATIPVRLQPESFHPSVEPDIKALPVRFDKGEEDRGSARRMAKVRVSHGGKSEEFWLAAHGILEDMEWQWNRHLGRVGGEALPIGPEHRQTVRLGDRLVTVTMKSRQFDVGRQIHVDKFWQKLDPGSSQARYFGSVIDLREPDGSVIGDEYENMEVSLNAPIDFLDPASGNTYRLFQESRTPLDEPDGGRIFFTTLTVNLDPGRGLKGLGCVLVVLGVITMFYMKAYFFKRQGRTAAARSAPTQDDWTNEPVDPRTARKRRKSMV